MSTQMQLKKIASLPGLLKREKTNKVLSFSMLVLMFTLRWITETEWREGTISLEKKT